MWLSSHLEKRETGNAWGRKGRGRGAGKEGGCRLCLYTTCSAWVGATPALLHEAGPEALRLRKRYLQPDPAASALFHAGIGMCPNRESRFAFFHEASLDLEKSIRLTAHPVIYFYLFIYLFIYFKH